MSCGSDRCDVVSQDQHDNEHGIEHLYPLLLFGLGSFILGLFPLPGAIECKHALENNTAYLPAGYNDLNMAWTEVHFLYQLTPYYAVIKNCYISIQVCMCTAVKQHLASALSVGVTPACDSKSKTILNALS